MADIRRIRPGLWVVETSVEDFDVRGVLIQGSERAVLFDTLARPEDLAGVADLVGDQSLTVIYSHGDWDHVWGTGGLSTPPAEILAHELCLARFQAEIPRTLEEKRAEAPEAFRGVTLRPPTRTFTETEALALGDLALELSPLPGHTEDSIVGYLPHWNVFLAGDAVETPLPFLNQDSPLDSWLEGLESWSARLDAREREGVPPLVIPSHGPLGDSGLLKKTHSYLRALLDGQEPEVPPHLSPFYRETHAGNRAIGGRWSSGSR